MADGYNTNNSGQFPANIRAAVKKEGVSRKLRARGLRYLEGIKHGQKVEMPPRRRKANFHLGNFAGNALAELDALNARPLTQRNAKRAALLQAARNRSKNPAYTGIPYELNANKSKTRRNGPNQTPPSGFLKKELVAPELVAPKVVAPEVVAPKVVAPELVAPPAENLPIKQNGMSGNNNNLNAVLNGLPVKGAVKPAANSAANSANAAALPAEANNQPTTVLGPTSPVQANYSGYVEPSEMLASGKGYNYSKGRQSANTFEPSSNALLPGYGTGGKASNINKGGINTNTNLQGPLAFAPQESNFANAGTNTQEAAAARVAEEKLTGNSTGANWAQSGTGLAQLAVAGTKPDYTITIVNSTVPAMPVMGKIGITIEPKIGGLSMPSLGMPSLGMPGMPKMGMPSWSGLKMDLSWLVLPSFPHFKLPETDIKGMLGKFLAALPTITKDQILAALKKGGKYAGIVLLSPLILAAWLWDHGFNLNIKLDGLTNGLISLEDWFLAGSHPAVKEIGRKLKMATDIAKRVVTNTIAEQELLQRQVNQRTRTQESVKQQILASLDSQIANIKTTLANLSADIKQVTVDPEYDNLINEIDFTGYKRKASNSNNAVLMAELNLLLDSIEKAFEGMAFGEEMVVAKANVEKFKQIRKNFDNMINLPQKIRNEIAKTAASAVGAKLKELGRNARSRTAKFGYNLGQLFSRGKNTIASLFGRQQTMSNANRLKIEEAKSRLPQNPLMAKQNPNTFAKASAANAAKSGGVGTVTKKKSIWNRVTGLGGKIRNFITRKKSNAPVNLTGPPSGGLTLRSIQPSPAAARTRKLRRFRR